MHSCRSSSRSEFAATADDLASLQRVNPPLSEPGGFGRLGDLPLIVVEHAQPFPGPFALLEKYWAAGQNRLVALSTKGELIVAQKSNHMIHLDEPDLVVNAIRRVHAAVRDVEELRPALMRPTLSVESDPIVGFHLKDTRTGPRRRSLIR